MTLTKFVDMFCCEDTEPEVYVFETEDELTEFAGGGKGYELLFTLKSSFKSSYYLKPEFANAEVMEFEAVGKGQIAVWVVVNHENG